MKIFLDRILTSVLTLPTWKNWLFALLLLLGYAAIVIPLGKKLKFLQVETPLPALKVFQIGVVALLMPALLEELVWRVLLIPHPTESIVPILRWFWVILSLFLFTIYHPLNFFVKHQTFKDPIFLGFAILLGYVCTLAYLESGSIWTPVFIHWAIVVVWLSFLGGNSKIHTS